MERLANLFSVTVMAPVAMQPGSRQPSPLLFHRGFKPGVFLHNSERKKGLPRILPNWRGPQAPAPQNWDQCLVYQHLHPQPETAPASRETGATV